MKTCADRKICVDIKTYANMFRHFRLHLLVQAGGGDDPGLPLPPPGQGGQSLHPPGQGGQGSQPTQGWS